MNDSDYFGKAMTGGANASKGFNYQDHCAIYYLLKNLEVDGFESIGIETDDDFTLIFEQSKVLAQIKFGELSLSLAKKCMAPDRILIGSTINKSLSTFLSYLKHYRNRQSSAENSQSKVTVTSYFNKLLERHNLDSFEEIPISWRVEVKPEENIKELIKLELMEWGAKNRLLTDGSECLKDLRSVVSECRENRDYLSKSDVLIILHKHSKKFVINYEASEFPDFIDPFKTGKNKILKSVSSRIDRAEALLSEKKFDEAMEIYSQLSKLIESEELFIKCATILQLLGRPDEAIEFCDKSLELVPESHSALAIKGILFGERGQYEFAFELLDASNFRSAGNPFVVYNLGVCCLKLGKIDQAIEYFEKAISIDPKLGFAHLNLAICLFNKGSYIESLKHIDMTLILKPGLPEALSQKGEIKRFYGEIDEAIKLFERCLQISPTNPLAKQGLAFCLLESGDLLGSWLLTEMFLEKINQEGEGKSVNIVDIGWKRTTLITIKKIDYSQYQVKYNGLLIFLTRPDIDMIGIGVANIQGVATPLVLKSYVNLSVYMNAVNAIQLGLSTEAICKVNGFVKDKVDHCEIRIEFENYSIYGKTDVGENEGFNAFRKIYKGNFLLRLNHKETSQEVHFKLAGLRCD